MRDEKVYMRLGEMRVSRAYSEPPTQGDTQTQKDAPYNFAPWKPPFHYFQIGSDIRDSAGQKCLDIRGWGFLTGTGGGLAIDSEKAAAIQDALGEHVTKLLNLTSVGASNVAGAPPVTPKSSPAPSLSHVLQMERDGERLDYLQELIRHCPHAQITFCDDPDCEEGAIGFMIRVEGCQTSEVCALTLREVIDKDIVAHSVSDRGNSPATSVESPKCSNPLCPNKVSEEGLCQECRDIVSSPVSSVEQK